MNAVVIDLKQLRRSVQADVPDLGGVLAQIIGEPFLFARLGYADELTLHFGTSRPADHPVLRAKGLEYGSYILAVCGSAWVLKSTPKTRLILEGLSTAPVAQLSKPAVEDARGLISSGGLFSANSPVVEIIPYEIEQVGGIGLRLETADGSGLIIVPVAGADLVTNEAGDFPDWELRTPRGLARVGPGRQWIWEPNIN